MLMRKVYFIIFITLIFNSNLFSEENDAKRIYVGAFFGSFNIYNLELATPGEDDAGFSIGIEGGTILDKKLLCGLLCYYGDHAYLTNKNTANTEKFGTVASAYEVIITTSLFPFSSSIEKLSGLFLRCGIGGAKFSYSSTHPEYKNRYDDVSPNYGISLLLGSGYAFNFASILGLDLGFDITYQQYLSPGKLDDTYILRVYAAGKFFI